MWDSGFRVARYTRDTGGERARERKRERERLKDKGTERQRPTYESTGKLVKPVW